MKSPLVAFQNYTIFKTNCKANEQPLSKWKIQINVIWVSQKTPVPGLFSIFDNKVCFQGKETV